MRTYSKGISIYFMIVSVQVLASDSRICPWRYWRVVALFGPETQFGEKKKSWISTIFRVLKVFLKLISKCYQES